MVGNDVTEDMVAEETGMQVFLLTDCLINKEKIFLLTRAEASCSFWIIFRPRESIKYYLLYYYNNEQAVSHTLF